MEAYDGPQIVGMDLRRRRSVLVRMTEDGRKLGTARMTNSPARLAAEVKRAGPRPIPTAAIASRAWYRPSRAGLTLRGLRGCGLCGLKEDWPADRNGTQASVWHHQRRSNACEHVRRQGLEPRTRGLRIRGFFDSSTLNWCRTMPTCTGSCHIVRSEAADTIRDPCWQRPGPEVLARCR